MVDGTLPWKYCVRCSPGHQDNHFLTTTVHHCSIDVLPFRADVLSALSLSIHDFVAQRATFSRAAGTMPSQDEINMYAEDVYLQAIIKTTMSEGCKTTIEEDGGQLTEREMQRQLALAFPDETTVTIFLLAKNMAPLSFDARQSTKIVDLRTAFRKHRHISKNAKIDVVWKSQVLPEWTCVSQLGLDKGDTLEMKVYGDE
jgi:hypothetical protein